MVKEAAEVADDPQPSGIIGQLPTEQEAALASGKDYATIKKIAWDKVKSLLGQEVVVKTKKNGSMTWKVIDSIDPDPVEQSLRYTTILSTGLSVSIVKITKKAKLLVVYFFACYSKIGGRK